MSKSRIAGFLAMAALFILAGCVTTSTSPGEKVSLKQASQYNVALGVAYLRQGNRDLAMHKLQSAIQQDPDNADAYSALGLLYDSIGDIDRADEAYRKALNKAPQDPQIQNNYAVFLCQHGKPEKSEKYFLQAAKNPLYPTPEAAYTNDGVCANRIPDPAAAEQYFRRALDINPNFPEALYQMARLSYGRRHYLEARAFIERFNSVSPQSRAAILLLGVRTEQALGNTRGAAEYAKKLLKLYPTSREAQQLDQSYNHAGRSG